MRFIHSYGLLLAEIKNPRVTSEILLCISRWNAHNSIISALNTHYITYDDLWHKRRGIILLKYSYLPFHIQNRVLWGYFSIIAKG